MTTAGIKGLRRIQGGAESIAGTKVPATWIWRGTGTGKDNSKITFVEEDIGKLSDSTRSYKAETGGEINFAGPATFEQLGYFLQSGVYSTTPTTDTSSAQVWTWTDQTADTDPVQTTDLQTYTMEFGDNAGEEYMAYCFTREIKLAGAVREALKVDGTIMQGRTVTPDTYTPTTDITISTPETILFTNSSLYIDNVTSSTDIGQTQVSQTLFQADYSHVTGWKGYPAADGRTDFSFVKRTKNEITLSLTFEHNSSAIAEKSAWRNQTERCIRLKFTGNTLSTTDGSAPYDTKTLIIDLWGKWESFEALTDNDGNDQVVGLFRANYSPTSGLKARWILVNELASMP